MSMLVRNIYEKKQCLNKKKLSDKEFFLPGFVEW